jgi:hypothetical protein
VDLLFQAPQRVFCFVTSAAALLRGKIDHFQSILWCKIWGKDSIKTGKTLGGPKENPEIPGPHETVLVQ